MVADTSRVPMPKRPNRKKQISVSTEALEWAAFFYSLYEQHKKRLKKHGDSR